MIAVIADDFTGAAEIGGVGLQRGMKVLIETEVSGAGNPDLLVIAADTRSMNREAACLRIEQITQTLLQLNPRFIYKKVDSVLRGHVYSELETQRRVSGKKRVLLVPANPHFNRLIRDGIYYVNGVPLEQTSFANDPEFPLLTSRVCELVGAPAGEMQCIGVTDEWPGRGFIAGNVTTETDLTAWAANLDDQTVYAGGAGYFQAILDRDCKRLVSLPCPKPSETVNTLFVFGSTFPRNEAFSGKLEQAGLVFFNLDENYFAQAAESPAVVENAAGSIAGRIQQDGGLVLTTIFTTSATGTIPPETVRKLVGLLVKAVFDRVPVGNLYIEGGATASQIFQNLNITRLIPLCELDYGIIQMQVEGFPDLILATKPGSYRWPERIVPPARLSK